MRRKLITLSLLLPLVATVGCVSPAERAKKEAQLRQDEEDRMRAPQDRLEVLNKLKTYKVGQTTLLQFLRDSGHEVTETATTVRTSMITRSRIWKIYGSQMQGGVGELTARYLVGYSGGVRADIQFKNDLW